VTNFMWTIGCLALLFLLVFGNVSWHRFRDTWAKAQEYATHIVQPPALPHSNKCIELELLNRHLAEQLAESVAGYERALEKDPRRGRDLIDRGRKTLDSLAQLNAERAASCKK
jgi:hypothetical protein